MCDSGRKDTLPTQMHTTFWIAGLPQEMSFKFVWGCLWHTFSLWRIRSETISSQSLWNISSCFYNYAVSPVQIASRNEWEPLPFVLLLQASPIITLQVSAHTHFLKDGWHDPYFFFFFLLCCLKTVENLQSLLIAIQYKGWVTTSISGSL